MTLDTHKVTATVDGISLLVKSGQITIDETRAPYIQGTLTVASTPEIDAIDPRQITRVKITLLQRFGDVANFTADLTDTFTGQLTSAITTAWGGLTTADLTNLPGRSYLGPLNEPTSAELELIVQAINEIPDGTSELDIRSDEAIVIGLRLASFNDDTNVGQGVDGDLTLRQAITTMLAGGYMVGDFDAGVTLAPGDFDHPLPRLLLDDDSTIAHLPWESGQSMWDAIQPALQLANARLIGLGDGQLHLVGADQENAAGPRIEAGWNLIDYTLGIDRDEETYGDAVIIRYSEPNGIYRSSVAVPDTGTYTTPLLIEVEGTCPINQFSSQLPSEPASRLLARARRRGLTAEAITVNDYSARPHQALALTIPDADPLTAVRQAIRWDIGTNWEMTNTLQEVEPAP